mmetsp:Transcript_9691/g.24340  ORF Transcript_9691/g.24340 Transcript_9691/m.24340 type:complete len:82 (-) Transcript_9691:780-1025(-)
MWLCFDPALPDPPTEAGFYDGKWRAGLGTFPARELARVRREGTALRFLQVYRAFSDGAADDAPSGMPERPPGLQFQYPESS